MGRKKRGSILKGIKIIVVAAIIILGGVLIYQNFLAHKQNSAQTKTNNISGSKSEEPAFSFAIADKNIEIKDKNSGSLIQTIPLSSNLLSDLSIYKNLSAKDIISLSDDVNFDGYKDLQVVSEMAATNEYYDYFIYNPSTEKFEADKILQDLGQPSFDPKSKTITTYINGGCAGRDFSEETLSFIDGGYVITETKEGNCCSDGEMNLGITANEYKNGKIEKTIKEACPQQ